MYGLVYNCTVDYNFILSVANFQCRVNYSSSKPVELHYVRFTLTSHIMRHLIHCGQFKSYWTYHAIPANFMNALRILADLFARGKRRKRESQKRSETSWTTLRSHPQCSKNNDINVCWNRQRVIHPAHLERLLDGSCGNSNVHLALIKIDMGRSKKLFTLVIKVCASGASPVCK